RLLGVRLQLLLECRELGKRRVRVRLLVAPAVAASLDVFRTQRWISIRPLAALAIRAFATGRALATLGPRRAFAGLRTPTLLRAISLLTLLGRRLTIPAPPMTAMRARIGCPNLFNRSGPWRGGAIGGAWSL